MTLEPRAQGALVQVPIMHQSQGQQPMTQVLMHQDGMHAQCPRSAPLIA